MPVTVHAGHPREHGEGRVHHSCLSAGGVVIEAVDADVRQDNPLRLDTPPAGPLVFRVRRHLPPMLIRDSRVIATIQHIGSDCAAEHSLADLAARCSLSPFHFHRLFAEVMGETVGGFIRRERMDIAAIHLLASPDSVQSIAATVGYGSLAAFNHAFRRQFGVAPTRYRELARQAVMHVTPDDVARAKKVRVESVDELSLIGLRFYGGYDEAESYWQQFAEVLRELGIALDGLQPFALIGDNPEITPNGLIRYECTVLDPGLPDPLPAPLSRYRIPAGRYASLRHQGPYDEIFPAYFAISPVWLQKHDERFGMAPAMERYETLPWQHAAGEQSISVMIRLR
jgi:AraC family transcriptional regulator